MADYLGFAENLLEADDDEADEDGTTWRDYVSKVRNVMTTLQGLYFANLHCIDDEMTVLVARMKAPQIDLRPLVISNCRLLQNWFESEIMSICKKLTEIIDDEKEWYG